MAHNVPEFYDEGVKGVIAECTSCSREIPIMMTRDQHQRLLNNDGYIQDIIPEIAPGIRDVLISGICPTCLLIQPEGVFDMNVCSARVDTLKPGVFLGVVTHDGILEPRRIKDIRDAGNLNKELLFDNSEIKILRKDRDVIVFYEID